MSKGERTPLVGQGTNGFSSYQTGDSAFTVAPTDGSLNAFGSTSSNDKKDVIISAHKAFQERDVEASILYHKQKNSKFVTSSSPPIFILSILSRFLSLHSTDLL